MSASRKTKYVVMSVLLLGGYAALAGIVTSRISAADQLGPIGKLSILLVLWGVIVYFAVVLWRHYRKVRHGITPNL